MIVDRNRKRLNAIKLRFVFFPQKCECCGEEYKLEKMWTFFRYGVNEVWYKWYFCTSCMHSKEEVLNEIDTDECPFGLAGIDSHFVEKTDRTRMDRWTASAFGDD